MDYMYVIFRSPVNLFKKVLSILYVLMDGLVVFVMCIVFHFTSCACSVHLHYLVFVCDCTYLVHTLCLCTIS